MPCIHITLTCKPVANLLDHWDPGFVGTNKYRVSNVFHNTNWKAFHGNQEDLSLKLINFFLAKFFLLKVLIETRNWKIDGWKGPAFLLSFKKIWTGPLPSTDVCFKKHTEKVHFKCKSLKASALFQV